MRIRRHRIRRSGFVIALLALVLALPGTSAATGDRGDDVALGYYKTLAEDGSPDAQLVLGELYHHGQGVSVNLVEAYAWYYVAAQQGLREALKPMGEVLQALPEAEWAEARALAEEYARRYGIPE